MSSSHLRTPLSDSRGKKANAIVLANAPQKEQPGGRRPYLLKMLQHQIGTYILADTLDWDGESLFPSRPRQNRRPPGVASCRPVVRNLK
jgi:hypothetical protein